MMGQYTSFLVLKRQCCQLNLIVLQKKRIGLRRLSEIRCSVCCMNRSCPLHAVVSFEAFIISLSEVMTAVLVCGTLSGYGKGCSILPEASIIIVLPYRDSSLSYSQE